MWSPVSADPSSEKGVIQRDDLIGRKVDHSHRLHRYRMVGKMPYKSTIPWRYEVRSCIKPEFWFQIPMNEKRVGIGLLLLDEDEPYVPGDPGNPATFSFPVIYRKVPGATVERVVGGDRTLDAAFISAAMDLESDSVRAISGCCGLFVHYQQVVSNSVGIPVALSSLLQASPILATLDDSQKLGILVGSCEREETVVSTLPSKIRGQVVMKGVFPSGGAKSAFCEHGTIDATYFDRAVVATASSLVSRNASVVAILLETSFFALYADSIRVRLNMPVFDFNTLIQNLHDGTLPS